MRLQLMRFQFERPAASHLRLNTPGAAQVSPLRRPTGVITETVIRRLTLSRAEYVKRPLIGDNVSFRLH